MGIQNMKIHHFTRGLIWDNELPSLTLGCKRLRPLAPKQSNTVVTATTAATTAAFDLKSFIRPENGQRKVGSSDYQKKELAQVDAQPGGTRWNPTQEQIGILEMLYRSGMRTPNAQQIEQITAQLGKYGKIEGKNVFYWFQNHKARERQKQKRNNQSLSQSPRTPPSPFGNDTSLLLSAIHKGNGPEQELESKPYKRKSRSWAFDQFLEENNRICTEGQEEGHNKTLELFPLHPEGRS